MAHCGKSREDSKIDGYTPYIPNIHFIVEQIEEMGSQLVGMGRFGVVSRHIWYVLDGTRRTYYILLDIFLFSSIVLWYNSPRLSAFLHNLPPCHRRP